VIRDFGTCSNAKLLYDGGFTAIDGTIAREGKRYVLVMRRNVLSRATRRGRLRFFEKLGGHLLDVPYVQPPVDGRTLVPMRLMFRTASGLSRINVAEANALTRAIYLEKYHAINQIPLATLEGLLVQRTQRSRHG